MKIGKVYPGTAAERAGLRAGDVIRSVNGYLTEQRGNLAWVIANAMPNNRAQARRPNGSRRENALDFGHYSLIVLERTEVSADVRSQRREDFHNASPSRLTILAPTNP